METKRSKQLCFGFALLVLVLGLQVRELPGPSCPGTEQFSTRETSFNAENSLSHSNVLLEQILLSDMNANSTFRGEKRESDRDCCSNVVPFKLSVLLSSHLSAFSLSGSFFPYIFGKEVSLLPCHFKQQQKSFEVCHTRWFSSVRIAASLFGVLKDVNVSWSICNAKQLNGISSRGSGCLVTMANTVGNSCQSLETKIRRRKLVNWNNHFGEQIYLFIIY